MTVVRRTISSVLRNLVLIVFALMIIIPIWMMFVSAFRQTVSILSYPPVFWPKDGNLDNFQEIFTMQNGVFFHWFKNSVIVSGTTTILIVFLSTMASYAFAKRHFPGSKLLFATIIGTQMIPAAATLIPRYLLINSLGWANTYYGLIVPNIASALGIFLMTQFIKDIPDDLIEVSRIDGASEYRIFFSIIVPCVLPSISLLSIFSFTGCWGELTWPLIVVSSSSMRTLPLGIASMKDLKSNITGPIMAATLASFLPVLIAFMFARDKFIAGMMVGAVKG